MIKLYQNTIKHKWSFYLIEPLSTLFYCLLFIIDIIDIIDIIIGVTVGVLNIGLIVGLCVGSFSLWVRLNDAFRAKIQK